MFIQFDEVVFTDDDLGTCGPALEHGIGHTRRVQLHGAHRIIVTRNHVIDAFRRAI